MKSNKQRRSEILAHRKARVLADAASPPKDPRGIGVIVEAGTAPCNPLLLAPSISYGAPDFVSRGYYVDQAFTCISCQCEEIWRATQQKWWYEVAKGNVESRAVRCRACRRVERERSAEARRIHLEGLAKKHAGKQAL